VRIESQPLKTPLIENSIVRMSSWRDRITLQAEWRKSDYDEIMIKRFLEDIKKIMLSILD
jgi:hypothetical protein